MNLQVLPLRVLVSRQVIRDRMDYTGHLAGKTRSEMDILDRLAGRFVVQGSELTVERFFGGRQIAGRRIGDEEEGDAEQFNQLPRWNIRVQHC